jgi:hypothetical protein
MASLANFEMELKAASTGLERQDQFKDGFRLSPE